MKKKYYTVQIIPEDSHEIKKFKVSTRWFLFGKIFLVIFIIVLGAFCYNLAKINRIVASYEKIRVVNAQLIKKDKNYEEMFERLDSLWILEQRIQNIFETFIENDSNKINSIIDRNRFAHSPSEKNEIDFEGHGWKTLEEKLKIEKIPDIVPVVGIVSKKFDEDGSHLGIDFSANPGNPVFATGTGTVEFAGKKGELGNTIEINHGNGYVTTYSHLMNIKTRKGSPVHKGDIIGSVGATGTTNGPHLHYTIIKDGVPQDPETYINY
ncbi:Peptidase family M23 [Fibrobacter sp. UWT3]|uniref:M23 family metallopeptidase n=1 Tax=Fibrobacter sp. UWT3 TaxID=1896225 RepID=UPI000BD22B42|nr:M23 family metallopeptidase [Fibrobacter sp. UWT3]SOE75898.1 Peptidase family M23 [Fibrobacter sp. UWT3]